VTFDGPVVEAPVDLLGAPVVRLRLAEPYRGLVVARLCDVWPDGRSTRISYAVRHCGTPDGGADGPDVDLLLDDTGYSVLPGHRLRLALSTTYWPMVWPEARPSTLRIDAAASWLSLPVRPPDPADASMASLGDPWRPPREADIVAPPSFRRETAARADGAVVVRNDVDSGVIRVRSTGVALRAEAHDEASILEDRPLSARMAAQRSVELRYAAAHVRVTGRLALTADGETWHLVGSLAAEEDGVVFWERPIEADVARSIP
jgi:hypothetical protein